MKILLTLWVTVLVTLALPLTVMAYSVPDTVRIGLEGRFREMDTVSVSNTDLTIRYEMNGQWLSYSNLQSSSGFTIRAENNTIIFYSGNSAAAVFDNGVTAVQVADLYGGLVTIGGSSYRGALEFGRYGGKKMTAVNVLSPEEYLYSVVASEMFSTFQPEALKAQAVAARSYMLTRMGVHTEQGYDLCDLSHCQNYAGVSRESDTAIRAVLETAGLAAYYAGQPINAVYFSSSGGVTDNSENVWVNAEPYLRSVPEITEYEAKEWTRSFTLNEITSLLNANKIQIGMASAITVKHANGRVQELTIIGTSGNKTLVKEEIRTFFSPSVGGTLESRNFTLSNGVIGSQNKTVVTVTDGKQTHTSLPGVLFCISNNNPAAILPTITAFDGASSAIYGDGTGTQIVTSDSDSIVFIGRGWGHGVGMSQRGAEGMARLGYDYITILKHYYTGIVIE